MKGFKGNIEIDTAKNENLRKVLYTGKNTQLVLMSLNVGEDISEEIHTDTDQFFRFESGNGKVKVDDNEYEVGPGDAVIVPAGAKHNVINTSTTEKLKMYTLYSPPHHKDGITRATKTEAINDEPEFDGVTTE